MSAGGTPMIYAVIVTWNSQKWIREAVESLQHSTVPVRTIVVDNASTDATTDSIRNLHADVEIIQLTQNAGFAAANNCGISRALEHGAEYILLLNQDAKISSNMLAETVGLFEKNPAFGIISPLQMNYEGTGVDPLFLSFISENSATVSDALRQTLHGLYEVPFINAAVWVLSRALVEKIGGFDPIFFMYGEDQDYCHRARFHGFKTGLAPKAVAYHWHGGGKSLQQKSFREQCLRQCAQILYRLKRPDHIFLLSLLGMLGTCAQKSLVVLAYGDVKQFAAMIVAWIQVLPKIFHVRRHYAACRQSGRLWI
jgi:GT2 family glycosyltransferase